MRLEFNHHSESSLGFSYLSRKNFFFLSLSYSRNLGSKSAPTPSIDLASSLQFETLLLFTGNYIGLLCFSAQYSSSSGRGALAAA
jgi:hypothetical protein